MDVVEKAAADSLSEDALKHFKTYKYSSVDKSPISNYILRHYVSSDRPSAFPHMTDVDIVECVR